MAGYDASYQEAIGYRPFDPRTRKHGRVILHFLRCWGCRNLAHKHENVALRSLTRWYSKYDRILSKLPTINKLREEHLTTIADLFDDLSSRRVTPAANNITMGPVPTSKTLLLLKSDLFAPWDNKIIEGLDVSRNGEGYAAYLDRIRQQLKDLGRQCRREKTSIPRMMRSIGRTQFDLPKLMDEYYYLKFTRKLDAEELLTVVNG